METSSLRPLEYTSASAGSLVAPPHMRGRYYDNPGAFRVGDDPMQSMIELQEALRTGRVEDCAYVSHDMLRKLRNEPAELINAAVDIQLLAAGVCSLLEYGGIGHFESVWSLRTHRGGRSRLSPHIDTMPLADDCITYPMKITCAIPSTRVAKHGISIEIPEFTDETYQPVNLHDIRQRDYLTVPDALPVIFARTSLHDSPLDSTTPSVFAEIIFKRER